MRRVADEQLRQSLLPLDAAWYPEEGHREAAVLAAFFERGGVDHLLLTQRRDDLPHHAGEVAFPGGIREGDESALDCALREFEEETGVSRSIAEPLGNLPARTSGAGFRVHAFVARIEAPSAYDPQEAEVAQILEVSFERLANDSNWGEREVRGDSGRIYQVPFFEIGTATLWGLTARLTLDLLARARRD